MKKILSIVLMFVIVMSLTACGAESNVVEIGHKNFTEQRVLAQLFGTLIEENTDLVVNITEFGGTNIVFEALKSGEISIYPAYTGTAYGAILGESELKDPDKIYNYVKEVYKKDFDVEWGLPVGFNNTYTFAVRNEIAEEYNLKTFSDLSEVANELTMIATPEFIERADGLPGVIETYGGFDFADLKGMDPGLRYVAIEGKKGDVMDAFSTDGKLIEFDLTILEDDKGFFPPYYAAPIFNGEFMRNNSEVYELLLKFDDTITEETMQQMNYKVDTLGENEKDVAVEFLKENGLIN